MQSQPIYVNQVGVEYGDYKLINKKTGDYQNYKIYREKDLTFLKDKLEKGNTPTLLEFNMKKLELEYDYDTEEEQLHAAKKMLLRENIDAIQFSVQDGDPLLLVDNLHPQSPGNFVKKNED